MFYVCHNRKTSLKTSKGESEAVNLRIDNTNTSRKRTKGQTTNYNNELNDDRFDSSFAYFTFVNNKMDDWSFNSDVFSNIRNDGMFGKSLQQQWLRSINCELDDMDIEGCIRHNNQVWTSSSAAAKNAGVQCRKFLQKVPEKNKNM